MRGTKPAELSYRCVMAVLLLSTLAGGCAGVKLATPLSVEALRAKPDMVAELGYTNANGVPSLAERMADRKGLKVAIIQVAYAIQGRPQTTITETHGVALFDGFRVDKITVSEVQVPPKVALAAAVDVAKQVERELAAQGFDVIAYEKVAATRAYRRHYVGNLPGYSLHDGALGGFTITGARPMGVKKVTSLIDFGQLHLVWPNTEALKAIKADLGEDTLMLCLKVQTSTMRGRGGSLGVGFSLYIVDPDYVGYGVGGFGHAVTILDGHTGGGTPVPGFVTPLPDGRSLVNWMPVIGDLRRVHRSFARGAARTLWGLAFK
jgi:hypothetical protein